MLAVLIEDAPRVVRKGDLHNRLWPGSFVSDATLVGLVKELLGKSGGGILGLRDDMPASDARRESLAA